MILEISIIFIIISLNILGPIKDKLLNKVVIYYLFLSIFCFVIFRDGDKIADYNNYVYIFNNYKKRLFITDIEISMRLIISILHSLNLSVFYMFLFYALLSLFIKFSLINKDTYPYIALLGYVSYELPNQEITAIRAGIAIAFVFLAIYSYVKNKKIFFYIFVIIATFFHYSCIVVIILPLFILLVNSRKKMLIIFLISLITPIFLSRFIHDLLAYIPLTYIKAKINQYTFVDNPNVIILRTFRFSSLLRYFIFFIFLSKINLIKRKNPYITLELQVLLIGILMNSLFCFSSVIQYRISNIFYSIEFFMYKNFLYIFKEKICGKFVILFICFFNFLYLIFSVKIYGGF